MKILLLNPPGTKTFLRDYYCTTVSKSDYYYHPVDLLYLSGTLSEQHEVEVLDALVRGLDRDETLAEIAHRKPDVVVALIAAPSFDEDRAFLVELDGRHPELRLVATGDVCREFGSDLFRVVPCLDASLVDFSTRDLLTYLESGAGQPIDNVIYRHGPGAELVAGPEKHANGRFQIPPPRIDQFPRELYSFPFVLHEPFMTVLSDFGCPYSCTFCPVSTLGFKLRPIEEVLDELHRLWDAGYREVHFRDQTFGVNKRRTLDLCRAIREELPDLTWSCFSRVDVLDEERISAMAGAGCHTVIVGIEFDDDELQGILKKNINRTQMHDCVELCHRHGLRIAGTFIVGLPQQDESDILRTGKLAAALDLDFASFNLATPRLGTQWRSELLADDQIEASNWRMDTVEGTTAWTSARISPEHLGELRDRVERSFYLRPRYLLKRLLQVRSTTEIASLLRNARAIVGRS